MKIILFLVIIAVLVSGCVIGERERDYAMSHMTPTDAQSSLMTPVAIPIPSTPIPPPLSWIKIDPIGDKQEGDIFTITASTNLPVGSEILIRIDPPMQHSAKQSREFSGGTDSVKVIQGTNGTNTISFIVNSTEFNLVPDEYLITETIYKNSTGRNEKITGYALFNIMP